MTKERIFITGAGGTIGRGVSKALVANGYEVVGFGLGEQYYRQQAFFKGLQDTGAFTFEIGSVLDWLAVSTAVRGCSSVIHLAAMLGGRRTEEQRLRCLDINVNGTDTVLSAAVAAGVRRFLLISSSAVYGEPDSNPVSETAETKPRGVYGVSKLMAEELTKGYAQLYPSLRYTILRLFNAYGDEPEGHIALNAFASRVAQGLPPIVNGDGRQLRCYVHVDDIAKAIMAALDRPVTENRIYNLGNPAQVFSLNDLANKIIDAMAPGSAMKVQSGGAGLDPAEIRESVADIRAAARDLDYRPTVTVDEGLRRISARLRRNVP